MNPNYIGLDQGVQSTTNPISVTRFGNTNIPTGVYGAPLPASWLDDAVHDLKRAIDAEITKALLASLQRDSLAK